MAYMRHLWLFCRFGILLVAFLMGTITLGYASGEIGFVRAPEEIPEGDDITVVVSASARETNLDRVLGVEYPESWKIKRAFRVESGAQKAVRLLRDDEVSALLSTAEPGHAVIALADNSDDFNPDADGLAYFIVFSTKPIAGASTSQSFTVKTALIERTSLDAISEIDPKTKKPKPTNKNWRMIFPQKQDFSFSGVTSKRFVATIKMERMLKTSRSLVLEGKKATGASLRTLPEAITEYFEHPFTLSFWFRTTAIQQSFIRLTSESGEEIRIGSGLLGQPVLYTTRPSRKVFTTSKSLTSDGLWHNLVLSRDSLSKLRLFVDAQPALVSDIPKNLFSNIISVSIGDTNAENDFALDELRMLRVAYRESSEFTRAITTAARDTIRDAFAVFHFDDHGLSARSSVPLIRKSATGENQGFLPISFELDTVAQMTETSSPVQLDETMLSADLLSPTRVSISWKTTSELGIKQYRIERRVGTFGPYEKVLTIEAKHGLKAPKRGQSVISRNSYSAAEDLPTLIGDIELFYRLAIVGFNEKEAPTYSVPVKLEYGVDRDVFVEQNQPNPFNPTTQIAFRLTKPTTVHASVFDILGREVALLVNGKLEAGRHTYPLDATNWPGGIYFYKVKTQKTTITRKMILAK